jgi:hypothetical protein
MHRKTVFSLAIISALTGAALLANAAGEPKKHGTGILHLFDHVNMTSTGALSNAMGRVDARQNEQGNANNQELDIHAQGLDTNTTYYLDLVNGVSNITQVATLTSDGRGRISVEYSQFGNGHGMGHGHMSLPAALNPVSEIQQLQIADVSTQAVLTADMTMPARLEYLIKRDISSNSVDASLRIHATTKQTQFRLVGAGLTPSSNYFLGLNGGIVQTNMSDAKGNLSIRSLLVNPTDILAVSSVGLWDSSSNLVLSTTLP